MLPYPGVPTDQEHLARLRAISATGDEIEREAAKPVSWAWQDLVVSGTINLIGGASTSGKTTLMFLVAMARAIGLPMFLGREITPIPEKQWSVIIEGEQSIGAASRKLLKCAKALRAPEHPFGRTMLVARESVIVGDAKWNSVVALCKAGLVGDLFLDTLASTTNAEANDEQAQVELFRMLVGVVRGSPRDRPTTLWLAAHTRKGEGIELEDVGGSAQRHAQVDTVIMLEKTRDPKTRRIKHSTLYFEKLKEDLPDDTDVSPVSYRVTVSGGVQIVARDSSKGGRPPPEGLTNESIVAFLDGKGPCTVNEVKAGLGSNAYSTVRDMLDDMARANLLKTEVRFVMGNPARTYELVKGVP